MPHEEENQQQPRQPTTHDTQQGVGQGTADRRRRSARVRVQDVSVSEASGLTLGVDGSPHPMETDAAGNLRVAPRDTNDLLEELILLQKATIFGISLTIGWDWQELISVVR